MEPGPDVHDAGLAGLVVHPDLAEDIKGAGEQGVLTLGEEVPCLMVFDKESGEIFADHVLGNEDHVGAGGAVAVEEPLAVGL